MAGMVPWSTAMERAAIGPVGFYRQGALAADHFRTSVTAAPAVLAAAVATLLADLDEALGPAEIDLVDVGAGGGELLAALAAVLPDRVRLVGVDVLARPADLPTRVSWQSSCPTGVRGLVIAHEYLDDLPIDVAELDESGTPRLVLVDLQIGAERLGLPISGVDREWVERWWPMGSEVGTRAEIGRHRDAAWRAMLASVDAGIVIAVDYDHVRSARPAYGTLTGYRSGRAVRAVPDGSCNLTAHVALDSCAAVGPASGLDPPALVRQHEALTALGVRSTRPPVERARSDPAGYVRALADAGSAAELLDPGGLGGFGWLVQPVGLDLPSRLTTVSDPAPTDLEQRRDERLVQDRLRRPASRVPRARPGVSP